MYDFLEVFFCLIWVFSLDVGCLAGGCLVWVFLFHVNIEIDGERGMNSSSPI